MSNENSGLGTANDASIETQEITSDDVAPLESVIDPEEQAAADRAESTRNDAEARVAAAQAKVDRLSEHLAAAQAALDDAVANRDNLNTEA